MSETTWYRRFEEQGIIGFEFLPSPDRFWPPTVLCDQPFTCTGVAGRTVLLTGPGAVWMYAHAAAMLQQAGAAEVKVKTPHAAGSSDDLQGSTSKLILAGEHGQSGALLQVQLRVSPTLSQAAVERLISPRMDELRRLRPAQVVLSGRANAHVYVEAARTAAVSGAQSILCWSARDGLTVVLDRDRSQIGTRVARPPWLAQAMPRPVSSRIIGVIGDPNRGKSVFCSVLDCYQQTKGVEGWKLDCDGQSPTPGWYLSLLATSPQEAREHRQGYKVPWTPEMEQRIAEQLVLGRELFQVLIADLPGGYHAVTPPQRIPPGRERLFAEVDALVLLEDERGSSERAWREELRVHGMESQLAAVLISRDPDARHPSCMFWQQGNLWRGWIEGLHRSRRPEELAAAYRSNLDQLWPSLLSYRRRASPVRAGEE